VTDIALRPLDERLSGFDVALDAADLATDAGLETAVILSLFVDRRAEPDDALPDGGEDRRGWWADAWPGVEGDRIGARLWLLAREKETLATLRRAEEYAEEALAWLIEDGVARRVGVTAERVRAGLLGLSVEIQRPDGAAARWQRTWEVQLSAA
jgi:phage gp46-like protein